MPSLQRTSAQIHEILRTKSDDANSQLSSRPHGCVTFYEFSAISVDLLFFGGRCASSVLASATSLTLEHYAHVVFHSRLALIFTMAASKYVFLHNMCTRLRATLKRRVNANDLSQSPCDLIKVMLSNWKALKTDLRSFGSFMGASRYSFCTPSGSSALIPRRKVGLNGSQIWRIEWASKMVNSSVGC